ncbi:MAG TPA: TA system VapC family ribonuclease toxin [Acidimicrobiales bacterium]|nr:TA system VapC family ribonuclease toxin [Acidimicrobiales bacterium]
MTTLLDGNVLAALAVVDHVHHGAARAWFAGSDDPFATSAITQGTLVRLLFRNGVPAAGALAVLEGLTGHERHRFWTDDQPYTAAALRGVIGDRQVTDGYLAAQARARGGRLATFDQGLAVIHADVVDLLPG